METTSTRKFKCVAQKDFVATIFSYRDVYLRVVRKNGDDVFKLSEYTPTNHIRKVVFNTLDECADYIDSVLDSQHDDIYWTVRASTLKWFRKGA